MTLVMYRAVAFTARAWTWIYTLPLEAADRDRRRHEIASDLWEFEADHSGGSPLGSTAHALARLLLGVPDDLLWTCERFTTRPQPLSVSTVVRVAMIAVATATVALSASGPTFDPTRGLRVNVEAVGWLRDLPPAPGSRAALAPAVALTLTNVSDQPTPALQVNAVFHRAAGDWDALGLGTAYAPVVGWRGLAAGTTSRRVLLQGMGAWMLDAQSGQRVAVPLTRIDPAGVRLFVHHDGRWTLVGDFAIPARRLSY